MKIEDALETTSGFYRPTFMRIFLDTDRSLKRLHDLDNLDLEAAYLHEYIHFIQDVSTVYGLNIIHVMTEYMRGAVAQILSNNKGPFKVPVNPIPRDEDNVFANNAFANLFSGHGRARGGVFQQVKVKDDLVQVKGDDVKAEYVEVTYMNQFGILESYRVGGLCILESMAFEIEHLCYGTPYPQPELPYMGARRLIEWVNPRLLDIEGAVVGLCDASLMHLNPGLAFFRTLERIRDEKIEIKNCWDLYEVCWDGIDVPHILEISALNAEAQLTKYFPVIEFKPVVEWLQGIVREAYAFRKATLGFPVLIAKGGPITKNHVLIKFMHSAGSPLVTNNLGEITVMDAKNRGEIPEQLYVLAINQIQRVLRKTQLGCELIQTCEYRGQSTDDRCASEPWSRIDPPSICPFSQVWNSWGLSGYHPF